MNETHKILNPKKGICRIVELSNCRILLGVGYEVLGVG